MNRTVLVLPLLLAVSLTGLADSVGEAFTINDITYRITNVDNANKEVCVTGVQFVSSQELVIPSVVNYDSHSYYVTKISGESNTGDVFPNKDKITRISGGANLREISNGTFSECVNLSSVNLSSSADLVWGKNVFYQCTALESATIDGSIAEADGLFNECTKLYEVTFGDHIGTTIPADCFLSCGNLANVNNTTGIKTIGTRSFMYASDLENFEWPSTLATVGGKAFYSSGLKEITLYSGVKEIGPEAFNLCKPITSVTCLAATPPVMTDTANDNTFTQDVYQVTPLKVNKNYVDAYKTAFVWQNFQNIQGITVASVEDVEAAPSDDAPAKYYNLQGVEVENPRDGIFIKVTGNTAVKIIL